MAEQQEIHLTVRGRVQGVGFRWFVREAARRGNLAGWVRNRDDGSVEIRASGEERALAALTEAVRRGPDRAQVDAVDEHPPSANKRDGKLPHPFTVLR